MTTANDNRQVAREQKTPGNQVSGQGDDIKFGEQRWLILCGNILIPALTAVITAAIAYLGWVYTQGQDNIANTREENDSVSQAIESRGEVLTNYAKSISDLMAEEEGDDFIPNGIEKDIIRGQTLVALRRLNPEDKFQRNNEDTSQEDLLSKLSALFQPNSDERDKETKNDAGESKGYLIRYLYELELLKLKELSNGSREAEAEVNLGGADLDNVVLKDAWLPYIDLEGAYLRKGDLRNTYLQGAKLEGAILTGANFSLNVSLNSEGTDFTESELFKVLSSLEKSDRGTVLDKLENDIKRFVVMLHLPSETVSETDEVKLSNYLTKKFPGKVFAESSRSKMLTELGKILTAELPSFRRTVLRSADLNSVDLSFADLSFADLGNADLSPNPAPDSNTPTDLSSANLRFAILNYTNLSKANLSNADLRFTDLRSANLTDANLEGACYVRSTEDIKGTRFPADFDPEEVDMVAIPMEESNPTKPDKFRSC
ncbi:MAG: pentapeptide repeat-containing protein [Elainellaceae cyanobacterium]